MSETMPSVLLNHTSEIQTAIQRFYEGAIFTLYSIVIRRHRAA
jgi:hypothetical protein